MSDIIESSFYKNPHGIALKARTHMISCMIPYTTNVISSNSKMPATK